MIDIGYYRKIQNAHGAKSLRDAQIQQIKSDLNKDFDNTLDVYTVPINGIEQNLTILKTTNASRKKIKSKPNETFTIGDYIFWMNEYWIITEADVDDKLFTSGKMERCNYLLKWQNAKGDIIERHAIISSASKYNDGENAGAVIILGSDQLSVSIPLDNESLHIKRKTKFFIDNNDEDPTVYELTGTNNVADSFSGKGVTSWIVKECAYSPTVDDLKYGVCNYVFPTTPSQPTTPDSGNENLDKCPILCKISYTKTSIKLGGSYTTFKGIITDSDGNVTTDIGEWYIGGDFSDKLTVIKSDNQIKIKVNESHSELIGKTFELAFSDVGRTSSDMIQITIEDYV